MTTFEQNMGDMVHESDISEAKKSLAMNYVRAMGKIANGSRGSVEAVCDALIAQTPIMIEMYRESRVDIKTVEDVIAKHIANCPGQIILRRGEGSDGAGTLNWQRMAFAVVSKATWPGAVIVLAVMFRPEIQQILSTL